VDSYAHGVSPAVGLPQDPHPTAPGPANESSIVAALREQLRAQKQRYETEIADLKAENKRLEQALAAAHGELHRRGLAGTSDTSQRRGHRYR
jgi:hypothetical protein